MSSAILKSLLCLFSSVLPDTLTNFIKGIGLLGMLSQMLVEKRSKICLFPYTSNQTRPGKAFIPTDFSCRGLAVTLSLKQLLFLVLQAPNPNPIYQPGWTSSHGRISLPKAVLWVFGPCNTESQFSLVSASL